MRCRLLGLAEHVNESGTELCEQTGRAQVSEGISAANAAPATMNSTEMMSTALYLNMSMELCAQRWQVPSTEHRTRRAKYGILFHGYSVSRLRVVVSEEQFFGTQKSAL
jgi:hypothetical protein